VHFAHCDGPFAKCDRDNFQLSHSVVSVDLFESLGDNLGSQRLAMDRALLFRAAYA